MSNIGIRNGKVPAAISTMEYWGKTLLIVKRFNPNGGVTRRSKRPPGRNGHTVDVARPYEESQLKVNVMGFDGLFWAKHSAGSIITATVIMESKQANVKNGNLCLILTSFC